MPLHRLAFAGLILLLFLQATSSFAQKAFLLQVSAPKSQADLINSLKYQEKVSDSLSAVGQLNNVISALHKEGYLLATWQWKNFGENVAKAYVLPGEKFEWIALKPGPLMTEFWKRLRFKPNDYRKKEFRIEELIKIEEKVLAFAEQNGFPFAQVGIDSLEIVGQKIGATMEVDLGPSITFDSLKIEPSAILKRPFAESYLGIELGETYDQRKVDAIVRRLNKLKYLNLAEAPIIQFRNQEAAIELALEKRRVNTVDGIIGFLPNNSSNNGLLITGQFDLELYNPFATGKMIGIHWRRLREETQRLELDYEHPHVLNSAISVGANFRFLKQDSTFNRRELGIDLNFNLGINWNLGVISSFINTDLIATSQYQGSNELPDILDFHHSRYGITLTYEDLDDAISPRRGTSFFISGTTGNKTINPNAALPNELYADVDLNTIQYQFDLDLEKFWRLGKRATLLTAVHGGLLFNDNLFRNDAYRLGGLRTIRGFNEGDFFATDYVYSNIESRFFLDETSYLLLFTDLGRVSEQFSGQSDQTSDYLLGLGTGLSFATNSGIFNFVYALGTSNSTGAINFNQSKIHFGFTTRF